MSDYSSSARNERLRTMAANDEATDPTSSWSWNGVPALPSDGEFTELELDVWELLASGEAADVAAIGGNDKRLSSKFLENRSFSFSMAI